MKIQKLKDGRLRDAGTGKIVKAKDSPIEDLMRMKKQSIFELSRLSLNMKRIKNIGSTDLSPAISIVNKALKAVEGIRIF